VFRLTGCKLPEPRSQEPTTGSVQSVRVELVVVLAVVDTHGQEDGVSEDRHRAPTHRKR
jgi:hypothetical protein